MNSEDIKKALECCSNPSINSCKGCPYNNTGEFSCCDGEMCKAALNLIIEQEKKIEQLTEERNRYAETLAKYQIASDKEIAAQVKQLKTECTLLDDELRNARQETINVLNELKAKSYVNDYCREVVEVEKIDELIKELIKNDNTRND